MKKLLLAILLLTPFLAFSQAGSMAVSGIKYRVNDSTTYIAAVAAAHAQGYSDIFWNNQATTPHFDIWNGSSYDHVFDFNSGGGGSGEFTYDIEVVTGTTHTINAAAIGSLNKWYIYTNASGCTVTMDDDVDIGKSVTGQRGPTAGTVTFADNGTSVLITASGDFDIEAVNRLASWTKQDATDWHGVGELGPGASAGLTTGTTTITSGTNTRVLYNNAGVLGEYTISGTGNVAMTTSPVFTTPNIGTATGSITGNAATVTTNANLTGHVTSTGNAAVLGSFSSSNLSTALTDEIGTGSAVFSESTNNPQTTDYVLVLSDKGKEIEMNVASANTVTVPANSSVAFPVKTKITILQYGAGLTSVVAGGGVTINSSSGTLAGPGQYNLMMLEKKDTDEWYLWNGTPPFTGAALTATDGLFDFTVNNGSNALVNAANFTATLNGVSSLAIGDLISSNATNQFAVITAVTAGRYLRSAGSLTLPVWSTLVLPNSINANRIVYGSSANTYGESANLTYDGSLFTVAGGTAFGYAAKTTTYSLTTADRFIECTSGTFTVTLPTAVGKTGIVYTVDNSGAGTITIATTSSQTIDGAAPGTLTAGQKITVYSNGANWRTF